MLDSVSSGSSKSPGGGGHTITDLIATRTSQRLEWYPIGLILIEIVLGLYDRFWK
jgi:uncharacterized Rmd1/YagE family protein